MATNTFKRYTKNGIGTSAESIYTVPTTTPVTSTVIIGGIISNTDGSSTVNTTVTVHDGTNEISLTGTDTPIPSGSALSFIDGKVVLQQGDVVKASGSIAGKLDVILSIMEIS